MSDASEDLSDAQASEDSELEQPRQRPEKRPLGKHELAAKAKAAKPIHNPLTDLVARGGSGGGPGGGGDGGSALPDQVNAGDFPELAENERNRKLLGAMF